MIEAQNLSYRIGTRALLHDVSLRVASGEVLAV